MIIRWLILLVALWAHFWLLGQWSLEQSMGRTLLLVAATVTLAFVSLFPLKVLLAQGTSGLNELFKKYWFRVLVYAYVIVVIALSVISFTGLIQYLLPIKVALLALYSFLKFKAKSLLS